MIAGVFLTAAELQGMYGLPWLAQALYLVLRQRMDFGNATVGHRPHVSWRALAEWCYVEPHPGMKGGTPSDQQMRRANRWLEKRGLVRMRSNVIKWQLIFFLPLAHRGIFLPEIKPTGSRQGASEGRRPIRSAKPTSTGALCIGTTDSLVTKEGLRPVDKLVLPPSLTAAETATIENLVRHRANGSAQAVLDELSGRMEKGAFQKGAVPYVRGLLKSLDEGRFTPNLGPAVRAKRDRLAERLQNQRSNAGGRVDTDRAAFEAGRAVLTNLRRKGRA